VIQHFKKACKNYVFKTWGIELMGFYSSPSKIYNIQGDSEITLGKKKWSSLDTN
jgi:hypothetical protein